VTAADYHRQIEAAEGYAELGMIQHARRLLEDLPDEGRQSRAALKANLVILKKTEEWRKAASLAEWLATTGTVDADELLDVAWCKWKSSDSLGALTWLQTKSTFISSPPAVMSRRATAMKRSPPSPGHCSWIPN
jgi:hypothetical protein